MTSGPLGRIDASDQAHQKLVNNFLTGMQAKQILDIVQAEVFGGQGVIRPVFTDYRFTKREKYNVESKVLVDSIDGWYEDVRIDTHEKDVDVKGYLSGIALDYLYVPMREASLFIGFTGTRFELTADNYLANYRGGKQGKDTADTTVDDIFQAHQFAMGSGYSYDCFGVAFYRFLPLIAGAEELQKLKNLRNQQAQSFTQLHSLEGISEQEILLQLRSPEIQHNAQQLVQNSVITLLRGFPGK